MGSNTGVLRVKCVLPKLNAMIGVVIFLLLHLIIVEINCYHPFNSRRIILKHLKQRLKADPAIVAKYVQEKWFTQRLDHNNANDKRTWQQRYYINYHYFKSPDGPIFLMIGSESAIDPDFLEGGALKHYAIKFKAMLIELEHRFYGESHPLPNITTENLRYLSSFQALSDTANFVKAMKKNYTKNSWIAFGGSYGGNLVAWYRLKFPDLVQGAVSSSGPVLAKVDFREYFQVVARSLSTHSNSCVSAISDAFVELGVLLKTEDGKRKLTKMFKTCMPLEQSTNYNDIMLFQCALAFGFGAVVQVYGMNVNYNQSINSVCNTMVNTQLGTPINRLAAVVNPSFINYFREGKNRCVPVRYKDMIDSLSLNTHWNTSSEGLGVRQWYYQTCSEFGYFQSSSGKPHIFGNGFPVEFFIQKCVDIFGKSFNAQFINKMVNKTNLFYGGLNIGAKVTNVAFVHGSLDPWHALGIKKTGNIQSTAVFIQGATHCDDFAYDPINSNSPQMTEAIKTIVSYIDYWLAECRKQGHGGRCAN